MVAASTAPDANGQIINVGSGVETSVGEVANLVKKATGAKPEIVYNSRNAGGVNRMCADLTLANKLLNYQPRVSLIDGLRMTLEQDDRLKIQ